MGRTGLAARGREAFDRIALADATGTDPGDTLDAVVRDIVAGDRSVLILIDD